MSERSLTRHNKYLKEAKKNNTILSRNKDLTQTHDLTSNLEMLKGIRQMRKNIYNNWDKPEKYKINETHDDCRESYLKFNNSTLSSIMDNSVS